MDLSGLLNVLNSANAGIEETKTGVTAGYGAVKAAQAEQQTGLQAAVPLQQIRQLQEENAQLTAQKNSGRAASSLGTNMGDASEIMTLMGAEMRRTALESMQASKKVRELDEGVGNWNPLALLEDLTSGEAIRSKAANLADSFNKVSTQFNALNSATQTVTASQNALAQTKSDATIAAGQGLIAQKAAIEASQIKERMATVDISNLQAVNQLNSQQLDLASKSYSAVVQEEQRQFQRAQIAFQNAMRMDAQADRKEAQALRNQDKQVDENILAQLNVGLKMFGRPPMTALGLATARKLNSEQEKKQLSFFASAGAQASMGNQVFLGSTPIEALTNVQALKIPLPPVQDQVGKKITEVLATTSPAEMINVAAPNLTNQERLAIQSDKAKMRQIQDQFVANKVAQWQSRITPNDQSNPYSLPTLQALQGERYLETNPFLRDVIAPLVTAASPTVYDPSYALKAAYEQGVKSGKYTTTQMADGLSWVSNKLKMDMNLSSGFQSLGMAPLDKVPMPVVVPVGNMAAKFSRTFDTSSAAAWNKAIVDITGAQINRFTGMSETNTVFDDLIKKPFVPEVYRGTIQR